MERESIVAQSCVTLHKCLDGISGDLVTIDYKLNQNQRTTFSRLPNNENLAPTFNCLDGYLKNNYKI